MQLLLLTGLSLIILFSFSTSAYLVQFRLGLKNLGLKVISFLAIGAAVTVLTLALAIIAIWPPYY